MHLMLVNVLLLAALLSLVATVRHYHTPKKPTPRPPCRTPYIDPEYEEPYGV